MVAQEVAKNRDLLCKAASFLRGTGRRLSLAQKRVFAAIGACRTAALGGHVEACDHCNHQKIS